MSDTQRPRRRVFLPALALAALAVGLPLAALAVWWGFQLGAALAGAANPYEAICRLPPADDGGALRVEELELRRRLSELESDMARRRGLCPVCQDPDEVDVALVVDTSLSMRWPATLDAAAEQQRMQAIEREAGPLLEPRAQERMLSEMGQTPAGQERMEAARRAALAAIEALPPRARINLFSFGSFVPERAEQTNCSIAEVGRFPGADRPGLQDALRGLRPDASGTPLARAIERGAASVRNRPAGTPGRVIIITDGTETCRADPCAAARAARQADPGLSILIVDIARNRQLACLAEATDGQVFAPDGAAEIGRVLAEALRPPPPQACVPRPGRPG
jgi:hypothetical protein